MNFIVKTIAWLILLFTVAHGGERGGLGEFANVRYERGALVVTTNESQAQFVGKIGNKGVAGILAAGTDIDVPLDETSLFYLRHQSLIFTPLTAGKGFVVQRITDLRSFRRGLKEESFSVNIAPDDNVTYGEVSVKEEPSGVSKNSIAREAEGKGSSQSASPAGEKPSGTETAMPRELGIPSTGQVGPEPKVAVGAEGKEGGSPAVEKGAAEVAKRPWLLIGMVVLVGALVLALLFRKN
ncbi:MAG: hypothetical protein ABI162_13130 [Luteolibacter sp.]